MPKIAAATVKEHHNIVFEKLVAATEDILRHNGPDALTAGAVAERAGIARNSIYRYVKSIDDLRTCVLDRYLPIWTNAVNAKVHPEDPASEQLLTIAHESLVMAQTTGHTWLINVMRHSKSPHGSKDDRPKHHGVAVTQAIRDFHHALAGRIVALWKEIDPERGFIKAKLTLVLIENGMTLLDSGIPREDIESALNEAILGMTAEHKQP